MKNNIDSNFAIAIVALVSACVGFAFWINQNLNDLSTGSSEYRILQSSQVNEDAGKKIATASEYKLFEVPEMGMGIMIKEQNYDDISYDYQKDEFGERVFVYSKSVVGSSPCTVDSFGGFSFLDDIEDGPYKDREPRAIVSGRSLHYTGPQDYCLGDQNEESIKARHRSVLDDVSSGRIVSTLDPFSTNEPISAEKPKIYTSEKHGVRFQYLEHNSNYTLDFQENERYITSSNDDIKDIEVFTFEDSLSHLEGIGKAILTDEKYDDECFVEEIENFHGTYPENYGHAIISHPKEKEMFQNPEYPDPWWMVSEEYCPAQYSRSNGRQYFYFNKNVLGKVLYIRTGQDTMATDGLGHDWSESIRIFE